MIGVDEVGRGAWAGPLLVVSARGRASLPSGVKDSKLLTKNQRLDILDLLSKVCDFGEGWVSPLEIDQLGLARAMELGVARSLAALSAAFTDKIVLDGNTNYCPAVFINSECVVNADDSIPIVGAASIYAKVKRDQFMQELSLQYGKYGFEAHVGYGTKAHQQALKVCGVIEGVHRLSYKPIKRLVANA